MKLLAFEYLLSRFIEWQTSSPYPFNEIPFNRVRSLKLLFLTATISVNGDDMLDIFDNFHAMMHGPVEYDVFESMRNDSLANYTITREGYIQKLDNVDFTSLYLNVKERIDASFAALKTVNEKLIQMEAFELVELTHKWSCWQNAYSVAELLSLDSFVMASNQIRESSKIYG